MVTESPVVVRHDRTPSSVKKHRRNLFRSAEKPDIPNLMSPTKEGKTSFQESFQGNVLDFASGCLFFKHHLQKSIFDPPMKEIVS